MKRHIFAAVLCTIGMSGLCVAQGRTTSAISAADLRQRLFRIADDSMKGRNTGSIEDSVTANYVAAEFKRVGLVAAGEHGGWFQSVPFMMPTPVSSSLKLSDGTTLVASSDFITIGRPSRAVDVNEFTPVFGGFLGDSTTWISQAASVDQVVVFAYSAPRGGGPSSPQFVFSPQRYPRARGVAVAGLGLLDPAQMAPLLRVRPSVDTARVAARSFQMLLTPRAADRMFGAPVASLKTGAVAPHAVSGNPALRFAPIAHAARNVIGVLPGSDPALRGQYVSLTAHNDHVGICGAPVDHDSLRAFDRVYRPMGADTRQWTTNADSDAKVRALLDSLRKINRARPDSICNGADDDGSGTVAILELAEYFGSLPATQRPRRSLLFVSHVAEEIGLVGSAWYTDHSTVPMDSIVAEIDEDMIGRGTVADLPDGGPTYLEVVGLRRLSNEFGDLMEAANATQRVPFVFNYKFDQTGDPLRYYCRADHYNYARYGVPSVALSRGEHLDYHQVTDEPQYIDYDDMSRVVIMVRDAVVKIANLDHRPKLDKPKGDPHAPCVQ